MDLDLVFLGTAGSTPTAQRAASATLLRRGGDRLLIDCAEGTQRQLLRSDVGLADLSEIFLTHLHADHYLGLPGMLKTFALRGRDAPLTIYGPAGLKDLVSTLRRIFGRLTYPMELIELVAGDILQRDDYALGTFDVEHGVSALGYTLVEAARPGRFDLEAAGALGVPDGPDRGALQRGEPVTLADGAVIRPDQVLGEARAGRRVALTGDTRPSAAVIDAVSGFDVLVHEATFCIDEEERARETGHSTAAEAAAVGRDAGVRLLALTHISSRYGGRDVEEEAVEVFPGTVVPRDFDTIEIPFPERGEPRLVHRGARMPRSRAETPA